MVFVYNVGFGDSILKFSSNNYISDSTSKQKLSFKRELKPLTSRNVEFLSYLGFKVLSQRRGS